MKVRFPPLRALLITALSLLPLSLPAQVGPGGTAPVSFPQCAVAPAVRRVAADVARGRRVSDDDVPTGKLADRTTRDAAPPIAVVHEARRGGPPTAAADGDAVGVLADALNGIVGTDQSVHLDGFELPVRFPEGRRMVAAPDFHYHPPDYAAHGHLPPEEAGAAYIESEVFGRTFTLNGREVTLSPESAIGEGGSSLVYHLGVDPPEPGVSYVIKVDRPNVDPATAARSHRRRVALRSDLERSANAFLHNRHVDDSVRVEFLPGLIPELESRGITVMRSASVTSVANPAGHLTVPRRYRSSFGFFGLWAGLTNDGLRRSIVENASMTNSADLEGWNLGHVMEPSKAQGMRRAGKRNDSFEHAVDIDDEPKTEMDSSVDSVERTVSSTNVALSTPLDLTHPRSGAPGRFNLGYRMETYRTAEGTLRQRLVIEVYDF